MGLLSGDLTTQQRVVTWMGTGPTQPSAILTQLISSMTQMIYSRLSRSRVYSQTFVRTFDGVGNMQLVLPDYPVTKLIAVQQGNCTVPLSVLPAPGAAQPTGTINGFGCRVALWDGQLPGENATLEFANGFFWQGAQNIRVTYQAGYLVALEPVVVPTSPYAATVQQLYGIWSRDNGVVYAATGVALTPVAASPTAGQYIPPPDATPGLYTFSAADVNANLLVSYSFVPADLEEACIQMVAERYVYRGRVGDISKSLGGQESIRYARGMPPEVKELIQPYVSVVYPNIGAPV